MIIELVNNIPYRRARALGLATAFRPSARASKGILHTIIEQADFAARYKYLICNCLIKIWRWKVLIMNYIMYKWMTMKGWFPGFNTVSISQSDAETVEIEVVRILQGRLVGYICLIHNIFALKSRILHTFALFHERLSPIFVKIRALFHTQTPTGTILVCWFVEFDVCWRRKRWTF